MLLRSSLSVVLALLAGGALAQGDDEFLLVNGTDYTIVEVTTSLPDMNFWGDDVLLPPALQGGEARKVKVAPFAAACLQDVRAKFVDDAETVVWKNLKMCNVKKLTLFFH